MRNSGCTMEAIKTIKSDLGQIKEKLEEKASDCSVEGLGNRVKDLEDFKGDLKPFIPVGKFVQNNTGFIVITFMFVICAGILKLQGMI